MDVVDVVDGDMDLAPMAHFRMRQPEVAGSWVPIVWLQCAHCIRSVGSSASFLEDICVISVRMDDSKQT